MWRRSAEPPSPAQAKEMALRFLARRDYAVRELQQKLVQRGVNRDDAAQVVDGLVDAGLLDDARFAEAFCRQKFASGHGPQRLRNDLKQRGVGNALVEAALAPYVGEWGEAVLALFRRRAGDLEAEKERARLYRTGLRRGFSHDPVMRAIDALRSERSV
jgi:regulatory protein